MKIQSKVFQTVEIVQAGTLHLELSSKEVQELYDALNLEEGRYFRGSTLPCDLRIELFRLGAQPSCFRKPT